MSPSPKKGKKKVPNLKLSSSSESTDAGPWSPPASDFDRFMAQREGQWSPTTDDFDKLIAEQDCFEISLREERTKNDSLTKDLRRLKEESKKNRQAYMKLAQEMQTLNMKSGSQEKVIKSLEDVVASKDAQIEELQKKLDDSKKELATSNSRVQMQPSSVPSKDLNNNNVFTVCMTEPAKPAGEDAVDKTPRSKNRRSLVSQLVQGFEAVVAAKKFETSRDSRSARRKTTIPLMRDEM